jgi:hypothetical protein
VATKREEAAEEGCVTRESEESALWIVAIDDVEREGVVAGYEMA